jgi:hypothetical protein
MRALYFLFLLPLLIACDHQYQFDKLQPDTPVVVNPLDRILGDKYISPDSIRPHNFDDLVGMHERALGDSSLLYHVEKADSTHYILRQTRLYWDARMFSLLVGVRDSVICDYHVLTDQAVADFVPTPGGWLLLCNGSDTGHWRTPYRGMKIVQLDNRYREVWNYIPQGKFLLLGNRIQQRDGKPLFYINVITGCSICYMTAEIELDASGVCTAVRVAGRTDGGWIPPQEELEGLFLGGRQWGALTGH